MLTFECITAKKERLSLSSPLKVTICRDRETPADSMEVVFPFALSEEISSLKVLRDGEEIFSGIADEQIVINDGLVRTKLICRSMAALLVDNEAYPSVFNDISASLVFERFVKPLGFAKMVGEDKTLRGLFSVPKGTSVWQVVENFCKAVWGMMPCVEGLSLIMHREDTENQLVFSDKNDKNSIRYTDFEHNKLRCKLLSCVKVKTNLSEGYSSCVTDKEAEESGVLRERYLNADMFSGKSLSDADRLISNARLKSEKITLMVPLCMTSSLGKIAIVDDSVSGFYEGFYVESVRYSFNEKGEETRLTLIRKGC